MKNSYAKILASVALVGAVFSSGSIAAPLTLDDSSNRLVGFFIPGAVVTTPDVNKLKSLTPGELNLAGEFNFGANTLIPVFNYLPGTLADATSMSSVASFASAFSISGASYVLAHFANSQESLLWYVGDANGVGATAEFNSVNLWYSSPSSVNLFASEPSSNVRSPVPDSGETLVLVGAALGMMTFLFRRRAS